MTEYTDNLLEFEKELAKEVKLVQNKVERLGLLLRPDAPTKPDSLLLKILSSKRAHGSVGDANFRMWLMEELKSLKAQPKVMAGGEGTIVAVTDKNSKSLFSCHIDTVHSPAECDGSHQKLNYDASMGHVFLQVDSADIAPSCLGADDGAGIYVLLKMIQKKVPGTYIFHTGEERGGIGARAMLASNKEFLAKFDRAVAFDRPGDYEVITHQGGVQCASNEAGEFIISEFKKANLAYALSARGVFTDTKVYSSVIPECFNLGVAYYDQHTSREYVDVVHLEALVDAAVATEWEKMPVVRKPVPVYVVPKHKPLTQGYAGGAQGGSGFQGGYKGLGGAGNGTKRKKPAFTAFEIADEFDNYTEDEIRILVEEDPEIAYRVMMLFYARLRSAETERDVYATILELN